MLYIGELMRLPPVFANLAYFSLPYLPPPLLTNKTTRRDNDDDNSSTFLVGFLRMNPITLYVAVTIHAKVVVLNWQAEWLALQWVIQPVGLYVCCPLIYHCLFMLHEKGGRSVFQRSGAQSNLGRATTPAWGHTWGHQPTSQQMNANSTRRPHSRYNPHSHAVIQSNKLVFERSQRAEKQLAKCSGWIRLIYYYWTSIPTEPADCQRSGADGQRALNCV